MTAMSFIPAAAWNDQLIDEGLGEDYQAEPAPAGALLQGRRPMVLGSCCADLAGGDRLRFPFRGGGAVAGGGDAARGLRVLQCLEHLGR